MTKFSAVWGLILGAWILEGCGTEEVITRSDGGTTHSGNQFPGEQGQGEYPGNGQNRPSENQFPPGGKGSFPQGPLDNGCGQFQDRLGSEVKISTYTRFPLLNTKVDVALTVDAQIGIKAEAKSGVFQFGGTITQANNALVQQFATDGFRKISEPMKLSFVTGAARKALLEKKPEWADFACLPAINKVENSSLLVEYAPAIPLVFPPNTPDTIDAVTESVTFTGITAVVRKSPDNTTQLNQPLTGRATIIRNGDKVTITYDFGNLKNTITATSFESLTYDIDRKQKRYNRIDAVISLNKETTVPVGVGRSD